MLQLMRMGTLASVADLGGAELTPLATVKTCKKEMVNARNCKFCKLSSLDPLLCFNGKNTLHLVGT